MPKQIIFIIQFLFLINVVHAQESSNPWQIDIDKAYQAFDAKKYNTSAGLFKKVYPKVKDADQKQKMLFMIAESYRRSNNFNQAIKWYEDLINAKYPDINILFSYGQLLKNFERYEEAERQFYDYLFEIPADVKGKIAMQSCNVSQQWKANPQKFNINNVKELNTIYSDYAPFYVSKKLVWSSSRKEAQGNEIFEWTGQKCSDFFEATLSNNSFGKQTNVKGAVNTNFNDGVGWIDSNETTFYFTRCNGIDGKGVNCKILVSYKENGVWASPTLLPFNSDSFSCGHPAFSPDGKRLFFSSDMKGGMGEKDIYYSLYDAVKDKWGSPVNLGPNVNSTEDDMFPFVDEKGMIYYASKGMIGMGGLDLFKTQDSANTFKKAQNLQSPINSGGDDFAISFIPQSQRKQDSIIAYFSSNRMGGQGDDDIYSIAIKPFVFLVKGKVIDNESKQLLPSASVTLTNDKGKIIFNIRSNDKGEFGGELALNSMMELSASKEKYFTSGMDSISSIGLTHDSILQVTLYLNPIPAQDVDITIPGIYYDLDKWDLRPASKKVLDSLIVILNDNPTLVVEIGSHTDSRAPAEYNLELSQKRAKSCVDYLVEHNINKNRLSPKGYGETKLVNDCTDGVDCTEEEHQQNRRTTFRVLRSDFKRK